jgi:ribonuclease-3 family protein
MEVSRVNMQANKYHKDVSKIVCAAAQAKMILAIEDRLSEEEQAIFKRGRNAKSYTKAKNASMVDYRNATGFEALLGYLYLQEDFKRLTDVVKMGLEVLEQDE